MRVEVRPSAADAALAAADLIAGALARAIAARGRASLALSGGSSPQPLFHALAARPLDWSRIDVFQVDERIAPPGDPARNLSSIATEFAEQGPLPRPRLVPMPVEADDLVAAARDYAAHLESVAGQPPVLDVVHLGLGTDGHTASLFPGDSLLLERGLAVGVTRPQAGYRRMTLTLPVLDRARLRVFFATGPAKAAVVAALAAGRLDAPAGLLRREDTTLVTDCP
jgi:6-phosphogluconolactonase